MLEPAFQNVMEGVGEYYRKNIPEDMTVQMEKEFSVWQENKINLAQVLLEAWINGSVDITPEDVIREAEGVTVSVFLRMLLRTMLRRREESGG